MGKLISLIYFYLVSIIAIILLIIGLYNLVSFGVNSFFYEKYPLPYGNEDCTFLAQTVPPEKAIGTDSLASISAEQAAQQKKSCEDRVESDRKRTQVNDIKDGIFFTLAGIILLSLHFPIALRRSRDK